MRLLLVLILALPVAVGCEKASTTSNPDLKVPEVPAGKRSQPQAK